MVSLVYFLKSRRTKKTQQLRTTVCGLLATDSFSGSDKSASSFSGDEKTNSARKEAGQRAVFTLVRTSGAAAAREMKDPTEGEEEKNGPSCRGGPTLWTCHCLRRSVGRQRPGASRHARRQKTAHLALCLQPPPETDASVWPRWVEPASVTSEANLVMGGRDGDTAALTD